MKTFFLLLFLAINFNVSARQPDTSAYQTQRLKVNALLNQRSAKFGQYDQSLGARTGIFGFQTKGDVKNSNEILRQIVLNDNNIFKELKILLDYKDQEIKRVKLEANTNSDRIQNYMMSIKKLQDENQRLKDEHSPTGTRGFLFYLSIILLFVFAVLAYFYYKKYKQAAEDRFPQLK